MLRRSFTFLGLMLMAWLLVVWARADAESPDVYARNIYTDASAEQVSSAGFLSIGGIRLTREWASPTTSTPGFSFYNPNGELTYVAVQGRGGGGFFVNGAPLVHREGVGWIADVENQNWAGIHDGGNKWVLRTQTSGTQLANLKPWAIQFTPGLGPDMSIYEPIIIYPDRTIFQSQFCVPNGMCFRGTSNSIQILRSDGGVLAEWQQ